MTMACTGRCKHCSEGEHKGFSGHIDGDIGAELVHSICERYAIDSVMTFGGEPLLYPEDVFKIQAAARDSGVPNRHIITNGFFSKDEKFIIKTAKRLADCGVTRVMLSVDAFHQETIPLKYPLSFAKALLNAGVFVQTHPAWLVSTEDSNRYNTQTRGFLSVFSEIGIHPSDGNIIFPKGNALKYFGEYFDKSNEYQDPYEESPDDIRTVSISSDGSVLNGNIYKQNIHDIMSKYSEAASLI